MFNSLDVKRYNSKGMSLQTEKNFHEKGVMRLDDNRDHMFNFRNRFNLVE